MCNKCLVVDRLEINLGVKLVDLILIDEILLGKQIICLYK